MNENIFDKLDFGPLKPLLDNDDITDISYDNNGQIWIRSLTQGSMRVEVAGATPDFIEKLAFQCSNVMGTTFNNAKPFLDAESAELRMNFVHQSIATNGIALVIRKTPAKIRLEKEKLMKEDYFTQDIHDFLIKCVEGHCNIMVAGETGSGKTEFVKYLASHTKVNEKIITIEDTLELHLDKIFPQRDIVAMKTNNVASYSDVLVTCMRQNPKWILLSEVRSAEAVSAVRNSISSGHNILSTIHADKASAIPYRLYSLMETDLDVNQFLSTIYRYIQLGVHIKAYYSKQYGKFHRELDEVTEFYVDDNQKPISRTIYQKIYGQTPVMRKPSDHLCQYLENQNIDVSHIIENLPEDFPIKSQEDFNMDESNEEVTEPVEETTTEAVSTDEQVTEPVTTEEVSTEVVEEPTTEMITEAPVEMPTEAIPVEQSTENPLEMPTDTALPTEVNTADFAVLPTETTVEQPILPMEPVIPIEGQAPVVEAAPIAPVEQPLSMEQVVAPMPMEAVMPVEQPQQIPVQPEVAIPVENQVVMPTETPVLPTQTMGEAPVPLPPPTVVAPNPATEPIINIQPAAPAIDINAQMPGTVNPPVALDSTPQAA